MMKFSLTHRLILLPCVGISLLLLAGYCVAAGRLARVTESALPSGVRIVKDIAYGKNSLQKLDVYHMPKVANAPIILMVHGGGWRRGDKAMNYVVTNKVNKWLPEGFIFISVNYRLLPNADPLQQAGDVAAALAFVQKHAGDWGGNPEKVILMGHSAGAHLVALLAAEPSITAAAGAKPWLGTVCLDSGALNVVTIMEARHLPLYDQAFGKDRQFWQEVSPTLRLASTPAPMLLVCSSYRADSVAQARAFEQRAKQLGGRATTLPVNLHHGPINAELGLPGTYTDQVDAFLQSLLPK